jgi:hypothetical protein
MSNGTGAHAPNSVDQHVGRKVYTLRKVQGKSPEEVAEVAEMSVERLRKCERGTARFHASELLERSRLFRVSYTHFFEGLDEPSAKG